MNTHRNVSKPLLALLLAASLTLTACSPDQVTQTLEIAVDATIAAAPAIEIAAGVSATTQQQVAVYLGLVQSCLTVSSAALSGANMTAGAAATIAGACSKELLQSPALPPGTPAQVVAAVSAVSSAVGTFLQALPKNTAPVAMIHGIAVNSFAGPGKTEKIKLDKKALARISKKLEILKEKMKTAHRPADQ